MVTQWIERNSNVFAAILLTAVGFLVWTSLETFLWRDDWLYLQFFLAEGESSFLHHFASDVKPLFQYILFAEFSVFGTAFHYYQLVNVVLMIVCGFAMYQLLLAFGIPIHFALPGGLLYLVHPTNFVNVFWISGQSELIHIALVLFAFLAYRKFTLSPGILPLAAFAICLFLQNFFFANGLFYPLVFLLLELLRGRNSATRLITVTSIIFVMHVAFAFYISQGMEAGDSEGLLDKLPEKVLFFFSFTANSITRVIVPNAANDPHTMTHWLALVVLICIVAWTVRRKQQDELLLPSVVALFSACIMLSLFRSSTTTVPYYYTSLQIPFLILIGVSLFRSTVKGIATSRLKLLWIIILMLFGFGDLQARKIFTHRNKNNRLRFELAVVSGQPYEPADDPALALPGYISVSGKSTGETAVILYKELRSKDH